MNARPLFQCGACGEAYVEDYEAAECCQPRVSEVFECAQCGETFAGHDAAEKCCAITDDGTPLTPEAHRINQIELEAAGQMRLLP